MHFSRSLERPT